MASLALMSPLCCAEKLLNIRLLGQREMRVYLAIVVLAGIVAAQEDILRLADGVVQGEVTAQARAFRGVPYATPPVGELRWKVSVSIFGPLVKPH